jgi:hypothetical protein
MGWAWHGMGKGLCLWSDHRLGCSLAGLGCPGHGLAMFRAGLAMCWALLFMGWAWLCCADHALVWPYIGLAGNELAIWFPWAADRLAMGWAVLFCPSAGLSCPWGCHALGWPGDGVTMGWDLDWLVMECHRPAICWPCAVQGLAIGWLWAGNELATGCSWAAMGLPLIYRRLNRCLQCWRKRKTLLCLFIAFAM